MSRIQFGQVLGDGYDLCCYSLLQHGHHEVCASIQVLDHMADTGSAKLLKELAEGERRDSCSF